jgi:MFS family permease
MFLISIDVTIVNVALPTIQHALAVPTGLLSWAVVAYTLPFATLMLCNWSGPRVVISWLRVARGGLR